MQRHSEFFRKEGVCMTEIRDIGFIGTGIMGEGKMTIQAGGGGVYGQIKAC